MKKAYTTVLIFGFVLFLMVGCNKSWILYVSYEKKDSSSDTANHVVTPNKKVKSRYLDMKDSHQNDWLNLPGCDSNTLKAGPQ